MSRIDDLIAKKCPSGVKYATLGEMGLFVRGNGLQKKDLKDSGFACIHYGQVHTQYGTQASITKSFVTNQLASRLRKAEPDNLIIATTSEDDEGVCKAMAWMGTSAVAVSGDCYVYRHSLNPLFVAYFFQTNSFREQKMRFITGTKVKRVSGKDLARIRLPVPSGEIQSEIVSILVGMEQLEAELETELEARRRQYDYYRNSLLSFDVKDGVTWSTLSDVAEIGTGSRNTIDGLSVGSYPFFVRSQEVRYMDSWDFDETAIITSGDGVGVGKIFHFVEGKYALHQRAYRIRVVAPELNPRFLFHFMHNNFLPFILKNSVHSSVTSVRMPMLKEYPVPIPPLQEQERIVTILDRFDALVASLSAGLPAELAARRLQYQYYRDKLLTFEEFAV